MRIPFLGGSNTSRSVTASAERTVNLYAEVTQDGKSPMVLYGTPGLVRFGTTATGEGRGMHVAAGRLFVVVGPTLYEIVNTGAATSRGTINTSTGPVSMADNGQQLVLVDGVSGWRLNLSDNVFAWAGAEWSDLTHVAFHDGYFVFAHAETGQFGISGLYSTDADPLDFATAEGAPDDIVSLLVDHRELWLFGEETTEVWYNSGAADFPFARLDGAFIEHGCVAAFSPAKMDNAVYWLSRDRLGHGHVMRAQGYQPQIVSTRAVEHAIQGYGTISDARGYAYQQEGHAFYVLTFPAADATWVYDAATQIWHERMYWDGASEHRHRGACFAFAFGLPLVLDHSNGYLYSLNLDAYTDDGAVLRSIRRTQHQSVEGQRLFWAQLQVDMQPGVGLSSGQGANPQAMLRWSDDGGHTWSSEHWRTMGRIGEYRNRAIWRRLGQSRDRVYELSISDPVKRAIVDAWADVEVQP